MDVCSSCVHMLKLKLALEALHDTHNCFQNACHKANVSDNDMLFASELSMLTMHVGPPVGFLA